MKNTILSFCVLGIAFSVVSSMVDISKFEKEVRMLFMAVVLVTMVTSLSNVDLSSIQGISLDSNPYAIDELSTEDYTQEQIVSQVESSIKNFLESNGLTCENISVSINITSDSCISINKIVLSTDDFPKAKDLITQNFGEIVVVNGE